MRIGLIISGLTGLLALVPAPPTAFGQDLSAREITGILNKNKAAIVRIRTSGVDQPQRGTGVVISPWGHVLTTLHVVGGANPPPSQRIRVTTFDIHDHAVELQGNPIVEKKDVNLDLAILRISGDNAFAKVSVQPVPENAPVLALIWNDAENVVRGHRAQVSTPDFQQYGERMVLLLDAIEGNSGSPVFDASGNVVAILTNRFGSDRRYSLAAALAAAPANFLPTLTAAERLKCKRRLKDDMERPFWEERVKDVSCDAGKPTASALIEYKAPPDHTIAGFPSHEDDVDAYGWVGAVMYEQEAGGRIASATLELGCKILAPSATTTGRAKTKLMIPVRKVLTDDDIAENERSCIARR